LVDNSYYVGIDVGSTICKAVAINPTNTKLAHIVIVPVQGDPEGVAKFCLKDISKALKQKIRSLKNNTIATGLNGEKISIQEKVSEITCIGAGAYHLNPDIRIVIDIGSFSMKGVKLDETGKIVDYMMNYKCAAGSGILLELVGEGLELDVTELSDVADQAESPIKISSQCSIFAESEVISYKNEGANLTDLVAGVCNSVAGRAYPLIRMLDKEPTKVAFTGGVAKNQHIYRDLEKRLELKLIELPIDPQFIPAYGAAVLAIKGGGS